MGEIEWRRRRVAYEMASRVVESQRSLRIKRGRFVTKPKGSRKNNVKNFPDKCSDGPGMTA